MPSAIAGDALAQSTQGQQQYNPNLPDISEVTLGVLFGPFLEHTGTNTGGIVAPPAPVAEGDLVKSGIILLLAGDSLFTSLISVYSGLSAIFRFEPVPEDVLETAPYCVVNGPISNERGGQKNDNTREAMFDVFVFDKGKGNPITLEDAAERVRILFDDTEISVVGFREARSSVSGPVMAPTGDDIDGFVLTVTLKLEE